MGAREKNIGLNLAILVLYFFIVRATASDHMAYSGMVVAAIFGLVAILHIAALLIMASVTYSNLNKQKGGDYMYAALFVFIVGFGCCCIHMSA